jgi:hypothetical protein
MEVGGRTRFVTHRLIDDEAVVRAVEAISGVA